VPERYVGQQLGRFRIDELAGSGGFAWVYRGWDPELEIPVAVKVLKPQFAGDETFETRFRREASTAARLRHPNIVRILAVGRESSAVFFVMDYLPSGLVQRLDMIGTLPESMLIRMGMDVAAALAFAHREGVIHRDVKTDNILFDEHGNAIVADFGIARAVTGYVQQTGTNMVVGTPQYFSPEQARGQALDGRADIYSLGVTLYKAGTGVLPFTGEDWYEIARQHIEEQPQRPRMLNPGMSRQMERIILKCLAKNPDERFPTGEALQAELLHLLARTSEGTDEPTVMMPTPERETTTTVPTPRHSRLLAALRSLPRPLGIGVGIGIAALLLLIFSFRDPEAVRPDVTDGVPVAPPVLAIADTNDFPLHGDTMARDTVPEADLPPRRTLVVRAPAAARVWLAGRAVGTGDWRTDTLSPGSYTVMASLDQEGCPTATDTQRVQLTARSTEVRLNPRACARVSLDVLPAEAQWVLSPAAGGTALRGRGSPVDPLLIPPGRHVFVVTAPYCARFEDTLHIEAGQERRERVRLIC
jgi:eukaryotic-like serine/threonine-protein kinase